VTGDATLEEIDRINTLVAWMQLLANRKHNCFKVGFDRWQLSARLGVKCQSQTTYLMLVEMPRAVDQSFRRNKRDDRLENVSPA
jgi:hypothetical protein